MSQKRESIAIAKAGFIEQDVTLEDGTILNYGEGPNNGKQPLLLIHGQTGAWQDYASVLQQLSKRYHVYAVDCHGHGKSSRTPEKYYAGAIGNDLLWFIVHVMGGDAVVSGHSSGGLLTAWLAANGGDHVKAAVLEDPPLFSTEAGERWENSFAYIDTYKPMHEFLNQEEEKDWIIYYLDHAYWGSFLGKDKMRKMVSYGKKYRKKHPGKPLHYWFLPDSINRMFWFQDYYDVRFGEAFYNCSWMKDFSHEETLKRIQCPCVLIHTRSSINEDGILMGAMSKEDADRACSLIPNCQLKNIDCGHDSHVEKPDEFLEAFELLP